MMQFFKAHAIGNDFILILTDSSLNALTKEFILKINHRFTGIGADQVLAIDSNNNVKIWTEDGAFLSLCGNGLRSLAKLLGHLGKKNIKVNTDSGIVELVNLDDGQVSMKVEKKPTIEMIENCYVVNVGNLHKIYFVEDHSLIDVVSYANDDYIVSFLSQKNNKWHARIMENHTTKETLACGSGSLACAYALKHIGETDLTIHFKYGSISHIINEEGITQVGPAEVVAELKFIDEFLSI